MKLKARSESLRTNIIPTKKAGMKRNSRKRVKHTPYFATKRGARNMIPMGRLLRAGARRQADSEGLISQTSHKEVSTDKNLTSALFSGNFLPAKPILSRAGASPAAAMFL